MRGVLWLILLTRSRVVLQGRGISHHIDVESVQAVVGIFHDAQGGDAGESSQVSVHKKRGVPI
jgi:hypothetical protein